jgi:exonuclease SbcD
VGGIDDIDVELFDDFDYVALGHLHAPQKVGRDTVRYAGSILKYSFSEAEQKKAFTIINMGKKGNIEIEKVPIKPINDMRRISGPIDRLLSKEIYMEGNVLDYIQVTLTDEDEVFDAARRLKMVYKNILKLDFDNSRIRALNKVENIENIEHKSDIELFSEFYKNRTNSELKSEELEVIKNIIRGGN